MTVLEAMNNELLQLHDAHAHSSQFDTTAAESILNGEAFSIGQTERSEDTISNFTIWVNNHQHNPAMKFFIPQLKRYLLAQVLGSTQHPDYTEPELVYIQVHEGCLHCHRTLCINYTSYDVLRQQDSLNPSTLHRYALLATDFEQEPDCTTHPYIYAKILGVYHANVMYKGQRPKRIEFIHVRWLYYDYDLPGGWDYRRLDCVSYQECRTDQDILDSFDFVHPSDIIRAAHLIPGFSRGDTTAHLGPTQSIAHNGPDRKDWKFYYVNQFVDCNMLMRYLGGGVGHFQGTAHSEEPESEIDESGIPEDSHDNCGNDVYMGDEDKEDESTDKIHSRNDGQEGRIVGPCDEEDDMEDDLVVDNVSDNKTVFSEEDQEPEGTLDEIVDDDLYGFEMYII